MPGKIYLVGAGPGSADLLTVRAANLLRAAQVVLHDDLVTSEVLALASPNANVVNVGKRCASRANRRGQVSQAQINALMIWHARRGKTVVRLKSGDPAVFGRLGEELDALREARVEFEIVPGVTAASAAASAAGITLTDRNSASALAIVTGHNVRGDKLRTSGLDPQRTTFAVYMPGPDYNKTARELMEAGVDCNTPVVLISGAGRGGQKTCFMSLLDLPFAGGVAAPAILIVGEVARRVPGEQGIDLREFLPEMTADYDENQTGGQRLELLA
jgi:uroporphyrin-III C-methyltransferase